MYLCLITLHDMNVFSICFCFLLLQSFSVLYKCRSTSSQQLFLFLSSEEWNCFFYLCHNYVFFGLFLSSSIEVHARFKILYTTNQISTWSSPIFSCHEAVDNGAAAAEEDSWDDDGDSALGDSSMWPTITGSTFNAVASDSSISTVADVVAPMPPHIANTPFLASFPLDITSLPLWFDADEEVMTDLQLTPPETFLHDSVLFRDCAGDDANSGKGLIWPSWKTFSMAWQTNRYWAGVWIMLARWSLMMRVNSKGYTGWFASIRYKADSIKISTPVRPIPKITQNWSW